MTAVSAGDWATGHGFSSWSCPPEEIVLVACVLLCVQVVNEKEKEIEKVVGAS
jgi:hypothetical protein